MSDFAQGFVLLSIAIGALVALVGVLLGAVSFGFFVSSMICFCFAFWVLWDHARDA